MPTRKAISAQSLPELCRWALGYAVRRWPGLLLVSSSTLANVGLDILKPWPMVFLLDYVLSRKPMPRALADFVALLPGSSTPGGLVAWSVAGTVVIFLLGWLSGVATSYGNISLGQRMTYDLATDLFTRLQQLSLHFHARKHVGDSVRRVTSDCGCVSVIVTEALLPVVSSVVSLVAMFCILWRIDRTLALLALAVVPFMFLVLMRYAGPMMDRSYEHEEVEGRIYDIVEQTFSSIMVVQAFAREDLNDRRFAAATGETIAATLRLTRVQLAFKVLTGLATALGTAAILWIGARHALAGSLSLGAIILFLSYLGSLYAPLEAIAYTSSTIQGAAGSARRVLEVLQTESTVKEKPGALTVHGVKGEVQFESVTFGYDPKRAVLRKISLRVVPGQTVALVGATGAGKSTLVSLIPRFADPWEGRVLLDGCDIRDLQLKGLRQHVAIVLQESFLFPMSVAENIAYACPNATQEQIENAARAANAHEFITRLPEGYNTIIGERGATLSGGERQRLSIARALLKNAPVLILDEPTSALDAETEALLLNALNRLTEGRATFIIAHRLSTVRRASQILVLKDGTIAETGTHDELLRRGGVYAGLYRTQFASAAATGG